MCCLLRWVHGMAIHYWFPVSFLFFLFFFYYPVTSDLSFVHISCFRSCSLLIYTFVSFSTLLHFVRFFFPPPWHGYFNYALFILIMRSFIMVLANCSIITLFLLGFANVQQIQCFRKCPQFCPFCKKRKRKKRMCKILYFVTSYILRNDEHVPHF